MAVLTALLAILADRSGDYVHLGMMYPWYRGAILRSHDWPVVFYWGDAAVWVTNGFVGRSLVYDDSPTHVPRDVRFDGAWARVDEHRLIGNFFIETVSFPPD